MTQRFRGGQSFAFYSVLKDIIYCVVADLFPQRDSSLRDPCQIAPPQAGMVWTIRN